MIKIKALTGPHAGKVREVPANVPANGLLAQFLANGWEWSLDFCRATSEEKLEWGRHDMSCRAVRALARGLPVHFAGREYRLPEAARDPNVSAEVYKIALAQVGQAFEDDVVSSRFGGVYLVSDDENGVVIGTAGSEEKLQ